MNDYTPATAAPLARLIDELYKLPGIGPKSAQRLAYYLLRMPAAEAQSLASAIVEVKQRVTFCSVCQNVTEVDPCRICTDSERDRTIVCVVEEPLDIMAIERTRSYRGLHHVLHGAISPIDGIGPEDLKIAELLHRLRSGEVQEIILATNPNLEGEATAMYLTRLLQPLGVRVTRLARGLPVGGDLEYADDVTLARCMLQLAQGHLSDVVAGCETLESFQPLREDLDRLSHALYAAELIDRFVPERTHSFPTYRLLLETLRRLAGTDDLGQTLRFFEMRLVDQCGFRPELEACSGCAAQIEPQDNFFAPQSGGVVCPSCMAGLSSARPVSLNALKVLRLLQRGSYNDVMRVRTDRLLAEEVERHLRSYIVSVLERDVNAASFIERLRREGSRRTVEV